MGRTIIAQQLGQQSGTDFPIMDDSDLGGGFRVVADATARDAIASNRRKETMRVVTIDDGKVWILQTDLTSWEEEVSSGSGLATVADTNALSGLNDSTFQDGYVAYVQTLKSIFTRRLGTIIGTNTVVHVDSDSGNAVWWRATSEHSDWDNVVNWYVDATSGNDEATGVDHAHPIKTLEEISRRLPKTLTSVFSLYTINVGPGGAKGNLICNVPISIVGEVTDGASATITDFHAAVPTTNHRQLTEANLPWKDDQFYRTTGSGTKIGYVISNPASGDSAETTFTANPTSAPTDPIIGDTITEINFPSFNGSIFSSPGLFVQLNNLKLFPDDGFDLIVADSASITNCIFPNGTTTLLTVKNLILSVCILNTQIGNTGNTTVQYVNCKIADTFNSNLGSGTYLATINAGCSIVNSGGFAINAGSSVIINDVHLIIRDVENNPGAAFYVATNGILKIFTSATDGFYVYGDNNADSIIVVEAGGQVFYEDVNSLKVTSDSGRYWSSNDLNSFGVWTDLPYYDPNRFRGIGKLSGSITPPLFVSNFAALGTLDDSGMIDGQQVYVETLRSIFFRRIGPNEGSDGITFRATQSGTAMWWRDDAPQISWINQNQWYIDASTGNDENDGSTDTTPVRSLDEISRRINSNQGSDSILINVLPGGASGNINTWKDVSFIAEFITGASATVTAHQDADSSINQREITTANLTWDSTKFYTTNTGLTGFAATNLVSNVSAETVFYSGNTRTNVANGTVITENTVPHLNGTIIARNVFIDSIDVNISIKIYADNIIFNNSFFNPSFNLFLQSKNTISFDKCIIPFNINSMFASNITMKSCKITGRIDFANAYLAQIFIGGGTILTGNGSFDMYVDQKLLIGSSACDSDLIIRDTANWVSRGVFTNNEKYTFLTFNSQMGNGNIWGDNNPSIIFWFEKGKHTITYIDKTKFVVTSGGPNWYLSDIGGSGTIQNGNWSNFPFIDVIKENVFTNNSILPSSYTELMFVNRAAISALNVTVTEIPNNTIARTTNVIARYRYDSASALTTDGINILSANGAGKWIRLQEPVYEYIVQTTWFVDYTSGNDENTGLSSGTAIKTFQEWYARTQGRFQLTQTLNLIGTNWPFTDRFHYTVISQEPTGSSVAVFAINGQQITSRGGTTTSPSTNPVTTLGSQEFSTIIDSAVTDWTGDVGKLIVASTGAYAWVLKDLGGGTHAARVTAWSTLSGATAAAPPSGTAYNIVTLTSALIFPTISTPSDSFQVINCDVGTTVRSFTGKTQWLGCKFNFGIDNVMQGSFVTSLFTGATFNFSNTVGSGTVNPTNCIFGSCGFLNSDITWSTGMLELQDCCFQGGHMLLGRTPNGHSGIVGHAAGVLAGTYGVGFFDATIANPAVNVDGRSTLFVAESLFGKGNLGIGTNLRRDSIIYVKNGNTPTLASVGQELVVPANPVPPFTPGLAVPATSPITTWADVAAAPFNFHVFTLSEWCRIDI